MRGNSERGTRRKSMKRSEQVTDWVSEWMTHCKIAGCLIFVQSLHSATKSSGSQFHDDNNDVSQRQPTEHCQSVVREFSLAGLMTYSQFSLQNSPNQMKGRSSSAFVIWFVVNAPLPPPPSFSPPRPPPKLPTFHNSKYVLELHGSKRRGGSCSYLPHDLIAIGIHSGVDEWMDDEMRLNNGNGNPNIHSKGEHRQNDVFKYLNQNLWQNINQGTVNRTGHHCRHL